MQQDIPIFGPLGAALADALEDVKNGREPAVDQILLRLQKQLPASEQTANLQPNAVPDAPPPGTSNEQGRLGPSSGAKHAKCLPESML